MAQSKELATEVRAMRRIETAFAYADGLPERAKARVLQWAHDEYLAPADGDAESAK